MKATRLQVIECLEYFGARGYTGEGESLFLACFGCLFGSTPVTGRLRRKAALLIYNALLNYKFINALKSGTLPPNYWTKEDTIENIVNGVF